MIKSLLKYKFEVSIILSVIIGCFLFIFGEMKDAPGLCLIGLVISFLLVMYGLYCKKIIRQGYTIPIILLVLGIVGIILTIILILDNEILFFSKISFTMIIASLIMISIGSIKILKFR